MVEPVQMLQTMHDHDDSDAFHFQEDLENQCACNLIHVCRGFIAKQNAKLSLS